MSEKELDELAKEAELLNSSLNWWQRQSAEAMDEAWQLGDDEDDIKKLKKLESKLGYLESKGHFEAEQIKEFAAKLIKYFTKRMKECQSKRKTSEE